MEPQTEWWHECYSGPYVDIVRQAGTAERNRHQVDFIVDLLNLEPPARILDVPCGAGRHSLELAARGYQLTGVDITEQVLEDAECKAHERQLDITWERRDMRALPWSEAFDGAYCVFGSFGFFNERGNEDFLRAVARALRPGAPFLLDAHVAETLLPVFQARNWEQHGDLLVLVERRFDHEQSRIEEEFIFVREGQVTTQQSSIRIYTYQELSCLLYKAGFADCEGVETMSEEPFRLGSQRLTMVATKGAS